MSAELFTPCVSQVLNELLQARLQTQAPITSFDLLQALEKTTGGAHSALANLSYNPAAPPPDGTEPAGELLFSTVVEDALSTFPERPAHSHHILLALLAKPDSLAARAMLAQGITAERIRQLGGLEDPPGRPTSTGVGTLVGVLVGGVIGFAGGPLAESIPDLPDLLFVAVGLGYLLAGWLGTTWKPVAAGPRRCGRCSYACSLAAAFSQNRAGRILCLDCIRRGERIAQSLCTALTLAGAPLALLALTRYPGPLSTLWAGVVLSPLIFTVSIIVHELGHAAGARLAGSSASITVGREWLPRRRFRAFGMAWRLGWPCVEGYVTNLRSVGRLGAFFLYAGGPLATGLLATGSGLLAPYLGSLQVMLYLTAGWNLLMLVGTLIPYQTRLGIPSDGAHLLSLLQRRSKLTPEQEATMAAHTLYEREEYEALVELVECGRAPGMSIRSQYGLSLQQVGRSEDAVALYRELVESADERHLPYVQNNLAWVLLWPRPAEPGPPERRQEAQQLASQAARAQPQIAAFRGTLATAMILNGEAEDGIALLREVMQEQTSARSLALNACMLAYAGADEEALRLARLLDPECALLPLAARS